MIKFYAESTSEQNQNADSRGISNVTKEASSGDSTAKPNPSEHLSKSASAAQDAAVSNNSVDETLKRHSLRDTPRPVTSTPETALPICGSPTVSLPSSVTVEMNPKTVIDVASETAPCSKPIHLIPPVVSSLQFASQGPPPGYAQPKRGRKTANREEPPRRRGRKPASLPPVILDGSASKESKDLNLHVQPGKLDSTSKGKTGTENQESTNVQNHACATQIVDPVHSQGSKKKEQAHKPAQHKQMLPSSTKIDTTGALDRTSVSGRYQTANINDVARVMKEVFSGTGLSTAKVGESSGKENKDTPAMPVLSKSSVEVIRNHKTEATSTTTVNSDNPGDSTSLVGSSMPSACATNRPTLRAGPAGQDCPIAGATENTMMNETVPVCDAANMEVDLRPDVVETLTENPPSLPPVLIGNSSLKESVPDVEESRQCSQENSGCQSLSGHHENLDHSGVTSINESSDAALEIQERFSSTIMDIESKHNKVNDIDPAPSSDGGSAQVHKVSAGCSDDSDIAESGRGSAVEFDLLPPRVEADHTPEENLKVPDNVKKIVEEKTEFVNPEDVPKNNVPINLIPDSEDNKADNHGACLMDMDIPGSDILDVPDAGGVIPAGTSRPTTEATQGSPREERQSDPEVKDVLPNRLEEDKSGNLAQPLSSSEVKETNMMMLSDTRLDNNSGDRTDLPVSSSTVIHTENVGNSSKDDLCDCTVTDLVQAREDSEQLAKEVSEVPVVLASCSRNEESSQMDPLSPSVSLGGTSDYQISSDMVAAHDNIVLSENTSSVPLVTEEDKLHSFLGKTLSDCAESLEGCKDSDDSNDKLDLAHVNVGQLVSITENLVSIDPFNHLTVSKTLQASAGDQIDVSQTESVPVKVVDTSTQSPPLTTMEEEKSGASFDSDLIASPPPSKDKKDFQAETDPVDSSQPCRILEGNAPGEKVVPSSPPVLEEVGEARMPSDAEIQTIKQTDASEVGPISPKEMINKYFHCHLRYSVFQLPQD